MVIDAFVGLCGCLLSVDIIKGDSFGMVRSYLGFAAYVNLVYQREILAGCWHDGR